MSKKGFMGKLTRCAALALVFGTVSGAAFQGTSYFIGKAAGNSSKTEETVEKETEQIQPTPVAAKAESTDISGVVKKTMPSIVAITSMTQQEVLSFFGQGRTVESQSSGSGIIIDKNDKYLYIATNNHVVEGAKTLTVQFSDGTTAAAEIRGTAPSNDLAVVQIPLSSLSEETLNTIKLAVIGDSEALSVGDAAIAIGNALGYGQSVTTGVVSALGREVAMQDESGQSFSNKLIQTDAAINPGNSGGALINVKGELIGINSSKYADTSVEGMGFAIPMETAKPILEDLIANGVTTTTGKPYLGIYGVDVTQDVSKNYNMPEGVYIAQVVEGSAAEEAGIVAGDIITKLNDKKVSSMEELKNEINEFNVGDEVTVTVEIADNGSYIEKELTVKLSSQK